MGKAHGTSMIFPSQSTTPVETKKDNSPVAKPFIAMGAHANTKDVAEAETTAEITENLRKAVAKSPYLYSTGPQYNSASGTNTFLVYGQVLGQAMITIDWLTTNVTIRPTWRPNQHLRRPGANGGASQSACSCGQSHTLNG